MASSHKTNGVKEERFLQFDNVSYNKQKEKLSGFLSLSNKRISWSSALGCEAEVSILFNEIKAYMVSSATSKAAMVKIDLKEAPGMPGTSASAGARGPYIFEFQITTERPREASFQQRDQFRDFLTDLIPSQTAPSITPTRSLAPEPTPPLPTSSSKPATSALAPTPPSISPVNGPGKPPPKPARTLTPALPVPSPSPPAAPAAPAPPPRASTSQGQGNRSGITDKDIRQRATVLARDKDLHQLYEQLVKKGVVTEDEFWETRKYLLSKEEERALGQRTGLRTAMMSDVQGSRDSGNEVHFTLTPAIISAIFNEYPSVHRAYNQNVPTKMKEQEFWTRYFESQVFFRDRNRASASSASVATPDGMELFADLGDANDAPSAEELKRRLRNVDPDVDLTANLTLPQGFGLKDFTYVKGAPPKAGEVDQKHRLIHRFNAHAALVVNSSDPHNLSAGGEASPVKQEDLLAEADKRATKVALDVRIKELEKEPDSAFLPLSIHNPRRYFEGHSTRDSPNESRPFSIDSDPATLESSVRSLQDELDDLQPNFNHLNEIGSLKLFREVLSNVTQTVYLQSNAKSANPNAVLGDAEMEREFKEQLRQYFGSTSELLRHFWACYPVTSQLHVQRLERLSKSMSQLYETVNKYRSSLAGDPSKGRLAQLLTPITQSLDRAFEHYEQQNKLRDERANAKRQRTTPSPLPVPLNPSPSPS